MVLEAMCELDASCARNSWDLRSMKSLVLRLLLLVACAAALRVSPASLHRPAVARSRVGAFAMQAPTAEDEEVVFEFGDAGGVSAATDAAIEEEVELTEQQKENARLRAAEKFMMRDTGNARCTVCSYKYSMEEGAPGTAPRNTPFELLSEKWACPSCGPLCVLSHMSCATISIWMWATCRSRIGASSLSPTWSTSSTVII